MPVERIFLRHEADATQRELDTVSVTAGAGIVGDRYVGHRDEPGQNITLIEAEEIEAFLAECRRPIDLSVSLRNIVTRGVRLNGLVGREFMLGNIRLRGVELCEPCLSLGMSLATPDWPAARVVKRLVRKAGLRADALSSGLLVRGASIRLVDEPGAPPTRAS